MRPRRSSARCSSFARRTNTSPSGKARNSRGNRRQSAPASRSLHIAVWEGEKLTREQAAERTGIPLPSIHWLDKFDATFRSVMCRAKKVFLNTNEHVRAAVDVETRDARFIRRCQREFPLHRYRRLAPLMRDLRVIKTPDEIKLIENAIGITDAAFRRVLGFVKPGVMEFEIEAEMIHEFTRRRADHAFPP